MYNGGEVPADLMEGREICYETLFRGELPYEPLQEDAGISVAGLARITYEKGRRSAELQDQLDVLPDIIDSVLDEHDSAARSGEDDEALFAFMDDDSRKMVGGIVKEIFAHWEVAYSRNGLGSLVQDSPRAKGLVLETAAAVMTAAGPENGLNLHKNKSDRTCVMRLISNWGPEFTRQWFDGTVISQWADKRNLSEASRDEMLDMLTTSSRKHFVMNSILDPTAPLDTFHLNMNRTLSIANISRRLGLSRAETARVFPPSTRKHFALNNSADPLSALETVKQHLEDTLTDASIADYLGWSEDDVARLFTTGIRRQLAVGNISDPLKACRSWVQGRITLGAGRDERRDTRLQAMNS